MRHQRSLVLLSLLAVLAAAATTHGSQSRPDDRADRLASPPDHLIVVVEENHSFEEIIGSPAAPFVNRLAAQGTLLTHSYAITHPSLPNYVALLSGRTPIERNCRGCTFTGPNLVDQLEAHHITWAAYLQGLPRPCSTVARAGAYTALVDPFMHAADIRHHPSRCDRVLPCSRFHPDLAAGRLPTVVFVMPDLYHEMHSGPIRVANAGLRRLVGRLQASPVWRQDTRLVLTFDESTRADVRSCCDGLGRGGRIPTIVAGPHIPPGRDPHPVHPLLAAALRRGRLRPAPPGRRRRPRHRHHPGCSRPFPSHRLIRLARRSPDEH